MLVRTASEVAKKIESTNKLLSGGILAALSERVKPLVRIERRLRWLLEQVDHGGARRWIAASAPVDERRFGFSMETALALVR